ncbi:hypothetical protein [Ottowia sp.]|uniref:hypothetical protein n=1 Tax=Ottowia sp. TaxID=1898956 RepID=UPI0025E004FE|nr:hypothetical protein [Ottowia sp.]MBK6616281.1 hypothetical protein [Ottowia sp.]
MAHHREPTVFTVSGHGEFPFDMLRFDECYPVNADSVNALGMSTHDVRARDSKRTVRLLSHRLLAPTVGRWESFGWKVLTEEELEALADARFKSVPAVPEHAA